VDIGSTRNLNKVLAPFWTGDKTQAVREALELQEHSDSIDFISYVLEHLGQPERSTVEELAGDVPVRLLMKMTAMLEEDAFGHQRLKTAVDWCEVLLPVLSPQVIGASVDTKFDNVVSTVQARIEKAASVPENAEALKNLLSQVQEASKS